MHLVLMPLHKFDSHTSSCYADRVTLKRLEDMLINGIYNFNFTLLEGVAIIFNLQTI